MVADKLAQRRLVHFVQNTAEFIRIGAAIGEIRAVNSAQGADCSYTSFHSEILGSAIVESPSEQSAINSAAAARSQPPSWGRNLLSPCWRNVFGTLFCGLDLSNLVFAHR
jgi:hypothetical protein